MNAAEYRSLLNVAINPLGAIIRAVFSGGVPVTDRQREDAALQLFRHVDVARLSTFAASRQYVAEAGARPVLSAPEPYRPAAPLAVIDRYAKRHAVTADNRRDPAVVRDVTRSVERGLQAHAERPARQLVSATAEASGGAWARVLTGERSCYFCAMLASRGPIYSSRHEAITGNATGTPRADDPRVGLTFVFHDGCDCIATYVPRASRAWEGRDEWLRLQVAWNHSGPDGDLRDDDDDRDTVKVFRSWWERKVRAGETARYVPDSISPTTDNAQEATAA